MSDPLTPFESAIADGPDPDLTKETTPVVFTYNEVEDVVKEHKGLRSTIDNLRRESDRVGFLKRYLRSYVKLVDGNYAKEELEEAGKECRDMYPAVVKFFDDEKLVVSGG